MCKYAKMHFTKGNIHFILWHNVSSGVEGRMHWDLTANIIHFLTLQRRKTFIGCARSYHCNSFARTETKYKWQWRQTFGSFSNLWHASNKTVHQVIHCQKEVPILTKQVYFIIDSFSIVRSDIWGLEKIQTFTPSHSFCALEGKPSILNAATIHAASQSF